MAQSIAEIQEPASHAQETPHGVSPTNHSEVNNSQPSNSKRPKHGRPSHRIKTERLIIRSAIPSDAQAIYDLHISPENNPYSEIEPGITPELYSTRIPKWQVKSLEGKSALVVVTLRPGRDQHRSSNATDDRDDADQAGDVDEEDGPLIGFGGFNRFTFEDPSVVYHNNPDQGLPLAEGDKVLVGDLGLSIVKSHWRRGYALEAMSALFDYAFGVLGCGLVTIDTEDDNVPMQNLLNKKLGLGKRMTRQQAHWTEKEHLVLLWTISKADWEAGKAWLGSNEQKGNV